MSYSHDDLPNVIPLVWSCLFTALIAVGVYIHVPFSMVSFYLSHFFVALAGLTLGPGWGVFSLVLYLGLGALNLPVFANGLSGIMSFFSPTGGFLLGYIPGVFLVGLLRDPQGQSVIRNFVAVLVGLLALYVVGVPFFALVKDLSFVRAVWLMAPYWGCDLVNAVFAVILARILFSPRKQA